MHGADPPHPPHASPALPQFNPKRMPKGVLPYGACTGRPLDHKEHTINKDANATRPAKPVPPPKKYQPAKCECVPHVGLAWPAAAAGACCCAACPALCTAHTSALHAAPL